jgi:hypothetical protein
MRASDYRSTRSAISHFCFSLCIVSGCWQMKVVFFLYPMRTSMNCSSKVTLSLLSALAILVTSVTCAFAQNQTPTTSDLLPADSLPYRIQIKEVDFGNNDLPTLHSYAVGAYGSKRLFISGRTNGMHGFDAVFSPEENFPIQHQNRDVWVVDMDTKQAWSKPLDAAGSGLTEAQILSLATTNNQFYQRGDSLYITGGYGVKENGFDFGTFDALSAIDLPGLGEWVVNGTGSAAANIRQIHDPVFRVTGGGMHEIDGKTHLVFGQDFDGVYTPFADGTYTRQVRSFEIVDDGTNLSVQNISSTPIVGDYRRRDLNVVPILRPDGLGGVDEKLVALSGVFTTGFGAWTVPVEVDANGQPTMADPNAAETFKQGFNGYHSAKLGLYSESSGAMHEVLFGGISLQFLDEVTDQVMTDPALPFINDITAVQIDALGNYSQHHLGYFPVLFDQNNLRLRFGTNAEFLQSLDVPAFANGVIDLDQIAGGETTLGYIFGGIMTNGPHTRRGAASSASDRVFEVTLIMVPEPSGLILTTVLSGMGLPFLRRFRSRA